MIMKSNKYTNKKEKIKLVVSMIKLALLLMILIGLPIYIYMAHGDFIKEMSSLDKVKEFLGQYHTQSIFVYIAAQALQIVICIIPGQWLQLSAGILYGIGLGFVYSLVGAALGSVISYFLAKLLGHDAVHLLFGEERFQEYMKKLNSKKGILLIFIIFLIPGIPKDLCSYVAGLSDIHLKPFLLVSLLGRSPAMLGSLVIGKYIGIGHYHIAIIIASIALALFFISIVFRKKIAGVLDRFYERLMNM